MTRVPVAVERSIKSAVVDEANVGGGCGVLNLRLCSGGWLSCTR